MAKYTYIDTTGAKQTIESDTPENAIKNAPNRDPNSGVQLQTSPILQDTTAIKTKDSMTGIEVDKKVDSITGAGTPNPTPGGTPTNVTTTTGDITGVDGKTYKQSAPSGYFYNLPSLTDGKKYVYDASGRPMIQDATGAITNDPVADAEYEKNRESITEASDYTKRMDSYKNGLDSTHQYMIDRIKDQYAIQKKNQEVLNKRMLGAKIVQGYRTGSAEYTPEIDTGILKAEEEAGMSRLAEIDANMTLLLAQTISAKNDKDFELVNKRFSELKELQKNKETTIQNIYKNYLDNAKIIDDKIKAINVEDRAQRDQALQELTTSAPELVKVYDSIKTQAQKDVWLDLMVKKTGLDRDVLLGSLEKVRLDVRNKNSIIDKRETPTEKAASITKQRDDDIASAILDFQEQMTKKNWAGINPQAYEYYKTEIRRLYGADAVLKYEKAIKDSGMTVDYGEGI